MKMTLSVYLLIQLAATLFIITKPSNAHVLGGQRNLLARTEDMIEAMKQFNSQQKQQKPKKQKQKHQQNSPPQNQQNSPLQYPNEYPHAYPHEYPPPFWNFNPYYPPPPQFTGFDMYNHQQNPLFYRNYPPQTQLPDTTSYDTSHQSQQFSNMETEQRSKITKEEETHFNKIKNDFIKQMKDKQQRERSKHTKKETQQRNKIKNEEQSDFNRIKKAMRSTQHNTQQQKRSNNVYEESQIQAVTQSNNEFDVLFGNPFDRNEIVKIVGLKNQRDLNNKCGKIKIASDINGERWNVQIGIGNIRQPLIKSIKTENLEKYTLNDKEKEMIAKLNLSKFDNNWQILGIKRKSTQREIKLAYREMARKYHPDKWEGENTCLMEELQELFKMINNAHAALIN